MAKKAFFTTPRIKSEPKRSQKKEVKVSEDIQDLDKLPPPPAPMFPLDGTDLPSGPIAVEESTPEDLPE